MPFFVIADLLGVPKIDQRKLKQISERTAQIIGKTSLLEAECLSLADGIGEFDDYFLDLFKKRRENPQEDLVSDLLTVNENGSKLKWMKGIAIV